MSNSILGFGKKGKIEIFEEKSALKQIRGDFADNVNEANKILENAEK